MRLPIIIALAIIVILLESFVRPVLAHDPDNREHDWWYGAIKQPDNPGTSCCGLADGYFCDNLRMVGEEMKCTITDDRPDEPRGRPHIPVGTDITIPKSKLIDAEQAAKLGNPTGHGIIWVKYPAYGDGWVVFCYVMPLLT